MKVLFLDIDGVLNGHEFDDEAQSCNIRRECVKRLNRVVNATGCKIVLSSAWRYMVHGGAMTLRGFGYMLRTHGLLAPGGSMNVIIDVTTRDGRDADPKSPPETWEGERGRQCREWLAKWEADDATPVVTAYAAVDDEDHGFAAAGIPAVTTDGGTGLTDADADALIRILNG